MGFLSFDKLRIEMTDKIFFLNTSVTLSSVSIYKTHSPCAKDSPTFLCSAKLSPGFFSTFAFSFFAMSLVLSVEPLSTTITSSAKDTDIHIYLLPTRW